MCYITLEISYIIHTFSMAMRRLYPICTKWEKQDQLPLLQCRKDESVNYVTNSMNCVKFPEIKNLTFTWKFY
jgi:hypothetical protein